MMMMIMEKIEIQLSRIMLFEDETIMRREWDRVFEFTCYRVCNVLYGYEKGEKEIDY